MLGQKLSSSCFVLHQLLIGWFESDFVVLYMLFSYILELVQEFSIVDSKTAM